MVWCRGQRAGKVRHRLKGGNSAIPGERHPPFSSLPTPKGPGVREDVFMCMHCIFYEHLFPRKIHRTQLHPNYYLFLTFNFNFRNVSIITHELRQVKRDFVHV